MGNSFDLLDWGSLTGKFNSLNLPRNRTEFGLEHAALVRKGRADRGE